MLRRGCRGLPWQQPQQHPQPRLHNRNQHPARRADLYRAQHGHHHATSGIPAHNRHRKSTDPRLASHRPYPHHHPLTSPFPQADTSLGPAATSPPSPARSLARPPGSRSVGCGRCMAGPPTGSPAEWPEPDRRGPGSRTAQGCHAHLGAQLAPPGRISRPGGLVMPAAARPAQRPAHDPCHNPRQVTDLPRHHRHTGSTPGAGNVEIRRPDQRRRLTSGERTPS
jgi:hypothetical protein